MALIYMPVRSPEEWAAGLAAAGHYKVGRSAHVLSHSWQKARGFPSPVAEAFKGSPVKELHTAGLLVGLPEHRVPLPGGARASQTDLFALARTGRSRLAAIAVEGKVSESFGPVVSRWLEKGGGRPARLRWLCEQLALDESDVGELRYQLLHRTASAVVEARRFTASLAVMLVHSFSDRDVGFRDYERFAKAMGAKAAKGKVVPARRLDGLDLCLGWVSDQAQSE